MKILVLSQYFWPEVFIVNDVVRKLSERGHEVVVATGKPNYPEGEVFPGYTAGGVKRERFNDGVEVVRVPLLPRGRGGARKLVLNYLSFVLTGLLYLPWLLRGRKFDVIFVFAPSPITQVVPAILLKWLKRTHLAVWVQDLWPESLAATGFIRDVRLLRMVGWMVRAIYKCCDTLLLQSRAFMDPVAKYSSRRKFFYYPNSISLAVESDSGSLVPEDLLNELDMHFSIVFAGNIGTAQAVETLVEAAQLLMDYSDVKLVLVGSGSRLEWVREQKELLGLDNLLIAGRFPMEAMPQIFDRSAALLVSLRDDETFAYTIPSKVQAYLAAGKPVIASLRGEGARVIEEARAGKSCEPENATALAATILDLRSLSVDERDALGAAGKAYFNEHFDMDRQVDRLLEILGAQIIDKRGL